MVTISKREKKLFNVLEQHYKCTASIVSLGEELARLRILLIGATSKDGLRETVLTELTDRLRQWDVYMNISDIESELKTLGWKKDNNILCWTREDGVQRVFGKYKNVFVVGVKQR